MDKTYLLGIQGAVPGCRDCKFFKLKDERCTNPGREFSDFAMERSYRGYCGKDADNFQQKQPKFQQKQLKFQWLRKLFGRPTKEVAKSEFNFETHPPEMNSWM